MSINEYYVARRWVVEDFSRNRVVDAFADDELGLREAQRRCLELNNEEDFADNYVLMLDGTPYGPFSHEEAHDFIRAHGIDISGGRIFMRMYSRENFEELQ